MDVMPLRFFSRLLHHQEKEKNGSRTTLGVGVLIDARYRLDAEIGRGGMGIVYRAHEIPNNKDVAIKVANLETSNSLTRQQFLQEVEITAKLHHPHIVAVYETGSLEFGAQESLPYIVMELIEGTNLSELHELTYARVIDIAKQICEALAYVHNQGFVYRDLKPGNVFVEKRGFHYFVKLTDFGLARPPDTTYLDTENSRAGSFFYLAPELIAGQPADIPSDLYALGATLYEMITGRVPFSDFDEQTILSQHLEATVIPPSQSQVDVPPVLEAIVLRLLAKDPNDRFASAQEVHKALEQITLSRQTVRGNLPKLQIGSVTDENDIIQIKQLLESNALVTILGNSESTALAVGTQFIDQFSDGVWWVNLESVEDPSLVLETVMSVLELRVNPHRSLTVLLIEQLREKNLLLILNRMDHVLGACAQLTETILHTCPDVRILVASSHPLNIVGEKCFPVTS
jgi:serine/threonine protein kinase